MEILAALIMLAFGVTTGNLATHQDAYCKCYRSNFDGKYCQSIKGDASQGSCHK